MKAPGSVSLDVNGKRHLVHAGPQTPLLEVLRNDLQLNSPKFGCGLGECGACTVLIDGSPARSCAVPVRLAERRAIITLEGLGTRDDSDPLQQAFIDSQAAQCGYCISGMVMTAKAFLAVSPQPSEAEIREALRFNLCRCGTHVEIVRAVMLAAERARKAEPA